MAIDIEFGTLKANGEQVAFVARDGDHKWEFPANPEIEKILNATCISFSPPDSPGYPSWNVWINWFSEHGFELTEIKHPPRNHESMSDEFINRTGMIP